MCTFCLHTKKKTAMTIHYEKQSTQLLSKASFFVPKKSQVWGTNRADLSLHGSFIIKFGFWDSQSIYLVLIMANCFQVTMYCIKTVPICSSRSFLDGG